MNHIHISPLRNVDDFVNGQIGTDRSVLARGSNLRLPSERIKGLELSNLVSFVGLGSKMVRKG